MTIAKVKNTPPITTFFIIWFGQLVSLLGTGMTRFALLIWAYQQTGTATTIALLGFFSFAPMILMSPIAGVWVDRLDRRYVMLFTDLGAGLMTLFLFVLLMTDDLEIWHLYVAQAFSGTFEAFQLPAYGAATTMLMPSKYYARASGMRSLAISGAEVLAPFFAGFLIVLIDIQGIMLIDIATFMIAMITLLIVRIPRPKTSDDGIRARGNTRQEIRFAFKYIFERRGLLGLVAIYIGMNFFATLTYFSILPAMVLARSGGDEIALGSVQAALGIGGIVGSILMSVWGGPRKKIHGILAFAALSFFFGDLLFAIGQDVNVWILGALLAAVFIPIIMGSNEAIWQMKVPPDIQGRVFSVRSMFQQVARPLAYLAAGPLADMLFEPAMTTDGSLAHIFGGLIGTGAGAGMGLMFLCTSFLGTAMSLSGYLFPAIRHVEESLPDHQVVA